MNSIKKYRFIGNPEEYNEEDGFQIKEGDVLEADYTPTGWKCNIQEHADFYPNDWELVEEESNKTESALRYNASKPKYSLLSLKEMEQGVKVLEFGANKYARDNWKKGLKLSEILDSMMRHIAALQSGEWIDPESGLPHIGHIQCNALFLGGKNNTIDMYFKCCGNWDKEGKCTCDITLIKKE